MGVGAFPNPLVGSWEPIPHTHLPFHRYLSYFSSLSSLSAFTFKSISEAVGSMNIVELGPYLHAFGYLE